MKQEQTHGILKGLRVFSSKFDQLRFFISNYSLTKWNWSKTWKKRCCTLRDHCSAISEGNWTKFMSFWKLFLRSFEWDWPKTFSPNRLKDMNLQRLNDSNTGKYHFHCTLRYHCRAFSEWSWTKLKRLLKGFWLFFLPWPVAFIYIYLLNRNSLKKWD